MRLPRYTIGAGVYDVVSAERPVYRAGRVAGVAALRLQPGDRVLDVGCGTGLNLPLLEQAVGHDGAVVGQDLSRRMLARAADRVRLAGWSNVRLVRGDAADLDSSLGSVPPFDAVLFTYSLSIIERWRPAFGQAVARLRPGGRIVVVDMSWPTGRWRALSPLVLLAAVVGGVDLRRAPWQVLPRAADDTDHVVLRGGHVHVVSGTKR